MGRELMRVKKDAPWGETAREGTKPKKGAWYQMWQTVSDKPYTPAFETPEELARWCADHPWGIERDNPVPYETWLRFINGPGWPPSPALVHFWRAGCSMTPTMPQYATEGEVMDTREFDAWFLKSKYRNCNFILNYDIADDVWQAATQAMKERAAKVIEDGQETVTNNDSEDGSRRHVTKRTRGNLTGIAFAAAIRALE